MIAVRYNVETEDTPIAFASAVSALLATQQGLSAELLPSKDSNGHVTSVWLSFSAPLRDSKVLSAGWREAYDFDVYFTKSQNGENHLEIEATLRPMVSRLAVGSLTQYQGLDDAQRNSYSSYFDLLLGDAN